MSIEETAMSSAEVAQESLRADAAELQALAAEGRLSATERRRADAELRLAEAEEAVQAAEDRAEAAEGRLAQKNLLMSQFEHKLKSSFLVLSGWARMLDESWDELNDTQRADGVRTIRERAEGVVSQARALLDEAHAEVALLAIEPVEIDLAELLAKAAVEHNRRPDTSHVFRYIGDDNVTAMADPVALQQVLGQLVENAVQYSPAGTMITLSTAVVDDEWCLVEVSDEGVGLPPAVDVFAPFVRGRTDVAGSGIGLYIVRKLAEAMGGTITGRSNDPPPGSTFSLRLRR